MVTTDQKSNKFTELLSGTEETFVNESKVMG